MIFSKCVNTIWGNIQITCENGAITGLLPRSAPDSENSCPEIETAVKALRAYENGEAFDGTLLLSPPSTAFERRVYEETSKIPFGETASYQDIAERIGNKRAARAVGSALHNNPIWIFIPCHRVIGKNGALTGYAGGLEMKRMLIEHEKSYFSTKSSAICTAFVAAPLRT